MTGGVVIGPKGRLYGLRSLYACLVFGSFEGRAGSGRDARSKQPVKERKEGRWEGGMGWSVSYESALHATIAVYPRRVYLVFFP